MRPPVARPRLDRTRIVDAAAEVVDRDGAAALSLAAVAAALGVRVPSLYHHVDGLPALRAALRERAAVELHAALSEATVGRAGRDALAGLVHGLREFGRRRPGLLAFTAALHPDDPAPTRAAAEALVGLLFAVLRGYELEGSDAVHAARVLRSAIYGFVSLEGEGGFALPEDTDRSLSALVHVLDVGLRSWGDRSHDRDEAA